MYVPMIICMKLINHTNCKVNFWTPCITMFRLYGHFISEKQTPKCGLLNEEEEFPFMSHHYQQRLRTPCTLP